MVNRRSESLSSLAHLWNESETDNGGTKLDEDRGPPTYSGLAEATQSPQPFAPDSPNLGCSDSQKSSSELRSASDGWPMRDCGTLNALYRCERTIICGFWRTELTAQLEIGTARSRVRRILASGVRKATRGCLKVHTYPPVEESQRRAIEPSSSRVQWIVVVPMHARHLP